MHDPLPHTPESALPGSLPACPATPPGRPSWSGLLQFSLVGIPLKAYPAVRTRDLPNGHLLRADCGQRIRYAKHCPTHGTIDPATIVRGFEYGPGHHLVVEPEELDQLRPVPDRALRLERFLNPGQLDPVLYAGRSLYLVPDGVAAEPGYAVLHAALVQRSRWALGRMLLGGHRQVVLVRPGASALLLQVLHYPEQVRACPSPVLPALNGISEELQLAAQLIDAASGAVDWSAYRDTAAQDLKALLEAKLQGQKEPVPEAAATILPLLEALRRGVAEVQPAAVKSAADGSRSGNSRKRTRRTA
jgi:DNA end-binding protein Ku